MATFNLRVTSKLTVTVIFPNEMCNYTIEVAETAAIAVDCVNSVFHAQIECLGYSSLFSTVLV